MKVALLFLTGCNAVFGFGDPVLVSADARPTPDARPAGPDARLVTLTVVEEGEGTVSTSAGELDGEGKLSVAAGKIV